MYGAWLAAKSLSVRRPLQVTARIRYATHPLRFRLKTSDMPTLKKIFVDREYGIALAKQPSVIVDAGANVGFAAVFFAETFPRARILAVEPEIANYQLLQQNVAPYPAITPVRCALWNSNVDVAIVDPGDGPWGYRTQPTGEPSTNVIATVPGRTLDALCAEYGLGHVDILKVDIEGGEKEVFDSCSRWIHSVGVVIAELHDHLKVGCAQSFSSATKDFEIESRRGENVFKLRRAYAAKTH
jgi:FkbM family methyltransferase